MLILTKDTLRLIAKTATTTKYWRMKQLNSNRKKHGTMMPIMLRRRKPKSLALENGSEACLEDVSEKILKAEFIHTFQLPKRLNAKLETFIESFCESLINQTFMNYLNMKTTVDLEQVLDIEIL